MEVCVLLGYHVFIPVDHLQAYLPKCNTMGQAFYTTHKHSTMRTNSVTITDCSVVYFVNDM